uniref:Uncharacterized protein n=1 Tax=Arundo donax TaxID=35708 RepID=A0A0A9GUJ8_ARUDO
MIDNQSIAPSGTTFEYQVYKKLTVSNLH